MNKRFRKNDIVIDLTSLLDVIFIVLLIVMCGQQLLSDTTREAAAEAEALQQEADETLREASALQQYYEKHSDAYENTEKYVKFIDVVAYFDSSVRITDRTIIVSSGMEGENPVTQFAVTAATEESDYKQFQDYLTSLIAPGEDGETVPVILSLNRNDDNILYRDEVAISNLFTYLSEQYDNVFVR